MAKMRVNKGAAVQGSGNVFADLGFAAPEEELARAKLAALIWKIIADRKLTQAAAGTIMGLDQPKVSALLNGRLANFSTARLMRFLIALGEDVDIVVRHAPKNRQRGRVRVVSDSVA